VVYKWQQSQVRRMQARFRVMHLPCHYGAEQPKRY
jgi:hypothetical protein